VDGANAWQRFVYITIPMLRRALMFVIVTTTIFSFQVFIPVYQLTKGGPGQSTSVIVYNIYQKAFIFGEMGYASALSMALLVIVLLISIVQMRLLRSDD
jgi:multiple sugar transport system permease protein/fructooligosaccharide transport system permease protein